MAWKRKPKKIGSQSDMEEISAEFMIDEVDRSSTSSVFKLSQQNQSLGFVSKLSQLPSQFEPYVEDLDVCGTKVKALRLHCGVHPRCILTCILSDEVGEGKLQTTSVVRVNQKLCLSSDAVLRVYRGETFSFDAREAALGNTQLRDAQALPVIAHALVEVRRLVDDSSLFSGTSIPTLSAKDLTYALVAQHAPHALVTVEERVVLRVAGVDLACRFVKLQPQASLEDADAALLCAQETHRGQITYESEFYVMEDVGAGVEAGVSIQGAQPFPTCSAADVVNICTSDEEVFPVPRLLLRPCIALTSVVQQGRGKYQDAPAVKEEEVSATIPVNACLFDRVLLFLEHELRSLEFTFDPVVAADLLSAASDLGLRALQDLCMKALGSFEERVRRQYISLREVEEKNLKGTMSFKETGTRCTTWIILSGAVYDISRWLEEHPGGSSIIPQHALDKDATGLFAIYHCSRQSFLYLKEFYIGELRPEDVPISMKRAEDSGKAMPSEMFTQHLSERTRWRLGESDLEKVENFKSF